MSKKSMIPTEDVSAEDMKVVKKKPKKEKEPRDLRSVFNRHLAVLDIEKVKKPWMNEKAFRIISDAGELQTWVDQVLAGRCGFHPIARTGEMIPAVAVDTETTGLDTRILVDKNGNPRLNIDIAGICLSADGNEGIYIPVTHEDGNNIDRSKCSEILQHLFDRVLVIFYNGKFDREVLRIFMGVQFRPYPYFEDVQVDKYLVDPKAELDGNKAGSAGGLKDMSKKDLDMEQIELDELVKVKADYLDPDTGKTTLRVQYAPFNWVPTEIALWYAASDAICTWLLWLMHMSTARSMKVAHKIDHELVDSISWVERQRFYIHVPKLKRIINWHQNKLENLRRDLNELTGLEEEFNPSSNPQLAKILFEIKGFEPYKVSEKTKAPSTDAETLEELIKIHPDDPFLKKLQEYREYVALHPENLSYEPSDKSARIHLRQCVVAGGRLSASGGDFYKDGGFGLNIQAIKRVEGNFFVRGRMLAGEPDTYLTYDEKDLDLSCFKNKAKAKGIKNNHVGQYFGDWYCLVPKCDKCELQHGPDTSAVKVDAEEIINLRALFVSMSGWTFFTTDYSNIEMRVAANISKEQSFIDEFLVGEGDFHSLTAKAVFPEFSDPSTPKDRKKFLRSLAKILNFALLYGGTAYTIFESMKKVDKEITFDACKDMVDKYWEGVPGFALWVEAKQKVARDEMICKTTTGRVVKFESAMKAFRIRYPNEQDKKNYKIFWDLKNHAKESEDQDKMTEARKFKARADAMYYDDATGVRNMADYKRFLGKIQRVSINIPLQGLAGDFMRLALNAIRLWAESDPGVENVLLLHGSVHDEIDYSVYNPYIPFIIPRITRLMKLRKIHEDRNWPVPIECDTEYGESWDVSEHLTGDSGHEPAGWTECPGLEDYIPGKYTNFDKILDKLLTGDVDKVLAYLRKILSPRVEVAIEVLSKYAKIEVQDPKAIRKKLVICYQLDEYWEIDQTPESETDTMEKLSEYEERMGLNPDDRPPLPPGGRLGTLRPWEYVASEPKFIGEIPVRKPLEPLYNPVQEALIEIVDKGISDEQPEEEVDLFGPPTVIFNTTKPKSEPELVIETKEPVENTGELVYNEDGLPIIRDGVGPEEMEEMTKILGIGSNKVAFVWEGGVFRIDKTFKSEVPENYIKRA